MFIGLFNISQRKKRTVEQTHSVIQYCVPSGEQCLPLQQSSNRDILPFRKGKLRHRAGEINLLGGHPAVLWCVSSSLQWARPHTSLPSRGRHPLAILPIPNGVPFPLQSKTYQNAQPRSKLLSGTWTTKAHLSSLLKQHTMNLGTSWLDFPLASVLSPAHKLHLHGHTMPVGCTAWGSMHPVTAELLRIHDDPEVSIIA